MRDLYLFDKERSDSFDTLSERYQREDCRNICRYQRDGDWGDIFTVMLSTRQEWYSKRCIKLKRKMI